MNNLSKLQKTILIILGSLAIIALISLTLLITSMGLLSPIPPIPTPAPTIAVLLATPQPSALLTPAIMPPTWTPQPSPINSSKTLLPSSTMVETPTLYIATIRAAFTLAAKQAQTNQPYLDLSFSDFHSEYEGFTWLRMTWKVHNTGTLAVYLLKIRVTILDKHGDQINNDSFFIDSEWLYPGTSSSFTATINDPDHATKNIKTDYASFWYKGPDGQLVPGP